MIVVACHRGRSHKRVDRYCKRFWPKAEIVRESSVVEALALACDIDDRGDEVTAALIWADIEPPEHVEPIEWRESCLLILEEHSIPFRIIDNASIYSDPEHMHRQQAIRSFREAQEKLDALLVPRMRYLKLQRKGSGYVHGRPPYGYCVKKGKLHPIPYQVAAIEDVFRSIREDETIQSILDRLVQREEDRTKAALRKRPEGESAKPDFWDRCKIGRILSHARLYCLGEYELPWGDVLTFPELRFLPACWLDTALPFAADSGTIKAP